MESPDVLPSKEPSLAHRREFGRVDDDTCEANEKIERQHDLGTAPASWRGYIPRAFPHGPKLLRLSLLAWGIGYAAFIAVLIAMPTDALVDESRALRPFLVSQERILVQTDGDEATRDVMRWLFLGRRSALSPCLREGQAARLPVTFQNGRLEIDRAQYPCIAAAMAPVRWPGAVSGTHPVTLTKVWLDPAP